LCLPDLYKNLFYVCILTPEILHPDYSNGHGVAMQNPEKEKWYYPRRSLILQQIKILHAI